MRLIGPVTRVKKKKKKKTALQYATSFSAAPFVAPVAVIWGL